MLAVSLGGRALNSFTLQQNARITSHNGRQGCSKTLNTLLMAF